MIGWEKWGQNVLFYVLFKVVQGHYHKMQQRAQTSAVRSAYQLSFNCFQQEKLLFLGLVKKFRFFT